MGRNFSVLAKLNWRFQTGKKNSLWTQVLRKKYCTQQRLNSTNKNPYGSAYFAENENFLLKVLYIKVKIG